MDLCAYTFLNYPRRLCTHTCVVERDYNARDVYIRFFFANLHHLRIRCFDKYRPTRYLYTETAADSADALRCFGNHSRLLPDLSFLARVFVAFCRKSAFLRHYNFTRVNLFQKYFLVRFVCQCNAKIHNDAQHALIML